MSIESVSTDGITGSVWVVTFRTDDDEHSHVAGVYDDEQEAREHKRDLADNASEYGAVAWAVHEKPIETRFQDGGH